MFLLNFLGEFDINFISLCVCSLLGKGGWFCGLGLNCISKEFVWSGLNKGISMFDNIFLLMLIVF